MEIKKVTTFKELDQIVPMMKKLYDSIGSEKYISWSGYLTWIALNFPLKNFQIWTGWKDDTLIGYIIVQITQRFFVAECHIVEAYMEGVDEEGTNMVYNKIVEWAKSKDCHQLTISTKRDKAFAKKYGFESLGTTMAKEI